MMFSFEAKDASGLRMGLQSDSLSPVSGTV
jgi:hypothetical protein